MGGGSQPYDYRAETQRALAQANMPKSPLSQQMSSQFQYAMPSLFNGMMNAQNFGSSALGNTFNPWAWGGYTQPNTGTGPIRPPGGGGYTPPPPTGGGGGVPPTQGGGGQPTNNPGGGYLPPGTGGTGLPPVDPNSGGYPQHPYGGGGGDTGSDAPHPRALLAPSFMASQAPAALPSGMFQTQSPYAGGTQGLDATWKYDAQNGPALWRTNAQGQPEMVGAGQDQLFNWSWDDRQNAVMQDFLARGGQQDGFEDYYRGLLGMNLPTNVAPLSPGATGGGYTGGQPMTGPVWTPDGGFRQNQQNNTFFPSSQAAQPQGMDQNYNPNFAYATSGDFNPFEFSQGFSAFDGGQGNAGPINNPIYQMMQSAGPEYGMNPLYGLINSGAFGQNFGRANLENLPLGQMIQNAMNQPAQLGVNTGVNAQNVGDYGSNINPQDSEYYKSIQDVLSRQQERGIADMRARYGAGGGGSRGTPAMQAEAMLRAEQTPQIAQALGQARQQEYGNILGSRQLGLQGAMANQGANLDANKSAIQFGLQQRQQNIDHGNNQGNALGNMLNAFTTMRGQDLSNSQGAQQLNQNQNQLLLNAMNSAQGADTERMGQWLQNNQFNTQQGNAYNQFLMGANQSAIENMINRQFTGMQNLTQIMAQLGLAGIPGGNASVNLSPTTYAPNQAPGWLQGINGFLNGVGSIVPG